MAKIEANLKAEVLAVCMLYCSQVWNEALNQVGVEKAPETMEIVLASLTVPVKADLASKGLEAASNQPVHGPSKDKIIMKQK
nr:hypothetical protein CFP56_17060 [Quercus suber]